jgi:carboxyl-terminal processing protease
MNELPFAGEDCVHIVLPERDPTLGGQLPLLQLERAEFEAELGARVEFATADPGSGSRWLLVLDPAHAGPPATSWEREAGLVSSRAQDVGGLFEAMNVWRTARREGGYAEAAECGTREEAIARVIDEVADTYPSFELRGLDWPAICARHVDDVHAAEDPVPAFQRWLAELEDSHTWVWPPFGNLPYVVRVASGEPHVTYVRPGSAGERAGVEPGWRLVAIDDAGLDAEGWLARTAAPSHSRPYLAGRRLLSGPVGTPRSLTALAPDGRSVTWADVPVGTPQGTPVSWRDLGSGAGYLRVDVWLEDRGIDEAFDAALADLRDCEKLILDLRRNPGGNLVLARRTQTRFLREETTLGSIRYSIGGGELSPLIPLTAEPASAEQRWYGRLVVLTDELTFSSSEDFLLGLQGLPHVRVVGRASGGGSGRPRNLPLLPGTRLMVSTALTYDRGGHCVEGAGIPVDVRVDPDDDALEAAIAL